MLKGAGVAIGASETMDPKAVDFSAQLAKIKASGGDTVFVTTAVEQITLILKQAKEQQLKARIITTGGSNSPDQLIQQAGASADGSMHLVFFTPWFPEAVKNPFYLMAPEWALIPLLVLATMAAVVASQALITGAFSVTKQVIQLGYLPRLAIEHTSVRETGQIYIPLVNWGLFAVIVLAVVMFRSSSNLAAAYGIAVCTDMLITTILTFYVIRYKWNYPLALCLLATGFFFVVDFAFFASNMIKLFEGGWFPLVIGGVVFTLMITWKDGRRLLNEKLRADAIDLSSFLEAVFVSPPVRVDGTAVFLTAEPGTVPNAMLHNLKHNKVLHDNNLFVTVRNHEVPWIGLDKRLEIESLGHQCWQVILHYGFKNDPDVPKALQQIKGRGCELDPMTTSYFLSRDTVVPTIGSGMSQWREKLFSQMHHNASGAADFLNLPNNSVVELGSKIEI